MNTINRTQRLCAYSLLVSTMIFASGCSDSSGESSREQLSFNTAPTFSSTANTSASAQQPYSYTATGEDIDGDSLSYQAHTLPSWLSFENNVLAGTPSTTHIGDHDVVLVVSDGKLSTTQSFTVTVALASNAKAWTMTWSDEFNGTSLDSQHWQVETGDGSQYGLIGWGNNELQWYQEENITVADGKLIITAQEQQTNNYNYTSGRMKSEAKVDVTYGRIEASVKAPYGQGLWSAFWMLPTNSQYGGWASGGEIDIMELFSLTTDQKVLGTIHYGMAWPLNRSAGGQHSLNVTDAFHLYAVEWEQDEIRWYADDVHYATVSSDTWWSYYYENSELGYVSKPAAPFDQDFHLLLNLAVGGNLPGSPDAQTQFPAVMEVDYVRVYQCDSTSQTGVGCVTNVNAAATIAAPSDVHIANYPLFIDKAQDITWHINDETVSRGLTAAIAWDNDGAISLSEVDIGGEHNTVLEISTSNMGNMAISATDKEAFALFGMGSSAEPWKLHAGELKFDLFINSANTTADSNILIKMDSGWPALGEKVIPVNTLKMDQWNRVSVPINDLLATPGQQPLDMNAVVNLFVIEFSGAAHVQLDNIALECGHKDSGGCGINPPKVEIEGEQITVFDDAVNADIWTNGIGAWDTISGADYFDGQSDNHVTWSTVDSDDADRGKVLEIGFSGNGADGLLYFQSAQPIDVSDYQNGALIFDIKVLDYAQTTSGISYKIDCIFPCTTGDQVLGVIADNQWQTITVPVTDLVNFGLNPKSVNTGLVIYPTWGDQQGVTLQIDNVRWEKSTSTDTPPPSSSNGLMIYDGTIAPTWELWDCCGGATVEQVQSEDSNYATVAQYTFNSTPTVAGIMSSASFDASTLSDGTLEFDLKVLSQPTDTSGDWLIKVEGITNQVFAELKLSQSQEGIAPQQDQWQHYTFALSELEAAGLNLSAVKIIMVFPTWGTGDGAVYQLDNVQFTTP
ncbi:hypothetical protein CWB96_17340 [Pseudoalteromonas citrea]|uniref:GH16 domain-containing protein n=1 Tax=Pseudoalteromonas citrea TaxID=43655 RepID=A0A5S3XKN4_9GAMM|nr:family 16 glycosylhydrolase [Pseudoalteromonas citrea]TMP40221.1 hypothetical protein CWB97_19430 [Pseudoalteromonas citrea]TMP55442.1 hypothetical protein CWB96_17340 [Pseudoalteromonas citrea]